MSVVEAVVRDLDALGGGLADGALAASAIALAGAIDAPGSATSKAMVAKELRETLAALRALAPLKKESDGVTDLSSRREARRARVAASADSARP